MGTQGLGWDGDGFTEEERAAVRGWLSGKATTIYGGSSEIQNNIISKRIWDCRTRRVRRNSAPD